MDLRSRLARLIAIRVVVSTVLLGSAILIQINAMGTTVLMATHNQEIVNAMRRRVLALEHGTLVRDESGAAYEREY